MKMLLLASFISMIALVGIFIFKVPVQSLATFGLVLLCPLLHLFMMSGRKHKH